MEEIPNGGKSRAENSPSMHEHVEQIEAHTEVINLDNLVPPLSAQALNALEAVETALDRNVLVTKLSASPFQDTDQNPVPYYLPFRLAILLFTSCYFCCFLIFIFIFNYVFFSYLEPSLYSVQQIYFLFL